jgi:hypothetical protein
MMGERCADEGAMKVVGEGRRNLQSLRQEKILGSGLTALSLTERGLALAFRDKRASPLQFQASGSGPLNCAFHISKSYSITIVV